MKRNVFVLLVATIILFSCQYKEDDIHAPSARTYSKDFALMNQYIDVVDYQYVLNIDKKISDSLGINSANIARAKADLDQLNRTIQNSLKDDNCLAVVLTTGKNAITKTVNSNKGVAVDFTPIDEGIETRTAQGSDYMRIDTNQGGRTTFKGNANIRCELDIYAGWGGPWACTLSSSTGKETGLGRDYILYSGTRSLSAATSWWRANKDEGANTSWEFYASPPMGGTSGSANFSW